MSAAGQVCEADAAVRAGDRHIPEQNDAVVLQVNLVAGRDASLQVGRPSGGGQVPDGCALADITKRDLAGSGVDIDRLRAVDGAAGEQDVTVAAAGVEGPAAGDQVEIGCTAEIDSVIGLDGAAEVHVTRCREGELAEIGRGADGSQRSAAAASVDGQVEGASHIFIGHDQVCVIDGDARSRGEHDRVAVRDPTEVQSTVDGDIAAQGHTHAGGEGERVNVDIVEADGAGAGHEREGVVATDGRIVRAAQVDAGARAGEGHVVAEHDGLSRTEDDPARVDGDVAVEVGSSSRGHGHPVDVRPDGVEVDIALARAHRQSLVPGHVSAVQHDVTGARSQADVCRCEIHVRCRAEVNIAGDGESAFERGVSGGGDGNATER